MEFSDMSSELAADLWHQNLGRETAEATILGGSMAAIVAAFGLPGAQVLFAAIGSAVLPGAFRLVMNYVDNRQKLGVRQLKRERDDWMNSARFQAGRSDKLSAQIFEMASKHERELGVLRQRLDAVGALGEDSSLNLPRPELQRTTPDPDVV